MSKRYVDDEILHISDDIDKIKRKPTMYISNLGQLGVLQLVKEVINNAIDETINPQSPANTIDIFIDEDEDSIMVRDNGRGIGEENLKIVCTKLQSGSKFERSGVGTSAGEYGVGLTACNALSEKFQIISRRYGTEYSIIFKDGKLEKDVFSTKTKHPNGTIIIFSPSKYYLEKDATINSQLVIDWLNDIKYLIDSKVTINLSINNKQGSLSNHVFNNANGLYDLLINNSTELVMTPIHLANSRNVVETYRGSDYNRVISIEFAFSYNNHTNDQSIYSFCNFVRNIDHGTHTDAVRNTISRIITKKTRESMKDSKKPLDVIPQDALAGIVLALYLKTDMTTQFSGQTKEKLNNPSFTKPISALVEEVIEKYFTDNPKELLKLIDIVKKNARARLASINAKNSYVKSDSSHLDDYLISNLTPANNTGKKGYCEIIILEGNSAGGLAKTGRYSLDTQALFCVRGVPKNTIDLTPAEVLTNKELKELTIALGCNIGDKFDIKKLKYDKIILLTDSDADGYHIKSSLITFFFTHMRDIVTQGKLFCAVAPLYKVDDKKRPFLLSKVEVSDIYNTNIQKNYYIENDTTGKQIKTKEFGDVLYKFMEYKELLENTANHLSVDPLLLEYVSMHEDDKDFAIKLSTVYPEIGLYESPRGTYLSGILNMSHQKLIFNDLHKPKYQEFLSVVKSLGEYSYLKVRDIDESDDNLRRVSFGTFLKETSHLEPKIIQRYKGIGELEDEDLRITTLDPNYRRLKRITVNDALRDEEVLRILHGNRVKDKELRKDMVQKFKISREELDN